MKSLRLASVITLFVSLNACGGGGDPSAPDAGLPDGGTVPSGPPAPMSEHPGCLASVDCPVGQHCDLGECVQDCNTVDACTGEKSCSPRARCLASGEKDDDPPPTTKALGEVFSPNKEYRLTDRDTKLEVKLETKSLEKVRYRVQLDAPHLSIESARGEFSGSTTLVFKVSTDALKGRDVPGVIRIFTNLGDLTVAAPIKVGVTGSYHGALRYDGGVVSLGDVGFSLDITETGGEAKVRVDSTKSVLFPADGGETTGRGTFSKSGGLDITLSQRIPKTLGGARNHFQRDLGRKLRLKLQPDARGNLSGTFEDTLYGLFSTPVVLKGTVALDALTGAPAPDFTPGTEPTMPSAAVKSYLSPSDVFAGWSGGTCEQVVCGATTCVATTILDKANAANAAFSTPLYDAFKNRFASATAADPVGGISGACQRALGKTSLPSAGDTDLATCGLPLGAACTLPVLGTLPVSDVKAGKAFSAMAARTLAPALLIAKDEIVKALRSGILEGPSFEKARFESATKVLGPTATWLLQPAVLEQLRSLPASAAKGDEPTGTEPTKTELDTWPAARALGDLFQTSAVLDGELARNAAQATPGEQPALAKAAQQRALLAFFEAAALASLVDTWGAVPPAVTAKLLGVLTPLDQGFAALSVGANVFGIPQGFVPFVYRAEDAAGKPTNFEQMLGLAKDSVAAAQSTETAFKTTDRSFEQSNFKLQTELTGLGSAYDLRVKDICGATFDPAKVTKPSDFESCGKGGVGEVGLLDLDITAAKARVQATESRLAGLRKKVQIELKRIADVNGIRQENLAFISSTGSTLESLTFMTGMMDAYSAFMSTASSAQIWNGGAPLALAAGQLIIGEMKAGLETQKVALQTAQTMKLEASTARIEVINGMAGVQAMIIDVAQAAIDGQQDMLAMVGAQLKLRNALATAKALWEERQRQATLFGKDPSNDPSFRVLRDQQAFKTLRARFDAQRMLFLSGSALAYEVNRKIPGLDGAVLNAFNGDALGTLQGCLSSVYTNHRIGVGTPQDYVATVSVRKVLGITGPRVDAATGETLSEGEQFRRLLLKNQNLDGAGGVGITFSTNLQPGNGLWSTDVCGDRIATVQAQLVGDFLGDNQAQVNLSLTGAGFLRTCDAADTVETWSFGKPNTVGATAFAVLQAGVNSYGDASPNFSLFGQSVARASWQLVIPGASAAPTNADLNLLKLEDVVLKLGHKATARKGGAFPLDLSCLSSTGK